jgi:hypothetical protein
VAEIVVGIISVLVGAVFSIRAVWRIWLERQAIKAAGVPRTALEWAIVHEKMIITFTVAVGQLIMGVAIGLALVAPRDPRPDIVREIITWSIVSMPIVLSILSINAEIAYHEEMRALKESKGDD